MPADVAIEAEGLRKSYGDVRALEGIDLSAPAGTVLGLLGPNGAGKTTAVRILTTLLPPDGGSARVAGLDVVREASELRTRIGLAGQYAAVDENLTGAENLEMVGRLYHLPKGEPRARAAELLERFDLSDAADRLVRTYSGGMRRRLDLAAALVARPPVLFLDEPTTGLDPRSRIGLWEMIEARVARGTTVLLTTQYLDEADRLADRIAVIDRGRVIAQGSSDELKGQIGGEWLDVTLEARGEAEAAIAALEPIAAERPETVDGVLRVPIRQRKGTIVEAVHRLERGRDRHRRRGDAPAHPRRRLPHPHRPRGRGGWRGRGGGARAMSGLRNGISDTLVLAKRSLMRIPRAPDLLISFTVQPIMFVLLFVYVFGGAIKTPGYSYVDFLMPGIIVQTMSFGGFVTALGLSEDLKKGLVDRFRSLPMARSAVLAGRTLADVATNSLSIAVMIAVGVIAGFSFDAPLAHIVAGILLLLLFGYAFSWVFAFVGITSSSPESSQAIGFIVIFPLTFVSSAFVPVDSMPAALEAFAEVNPFTITVDAIRALFLGAPAGNDVWGAVAWSLGITAVFAFLSVNRYKRAVVR